MAKTKSRVIRIRRSLNLNIGLVIFLVFFIYLLYNILAWMGRDKISIYEVTEVENTIEDSVYYNALILRDEQVYTTSTAGYVNYYLRESTRASVGSPVYSIDEKGTYTALLSSASTSENTLSDEELTSLEKKISAYSADYDGTDFSDIYSVKYSLQNLILTGLGSGTLENLDALGVDTSSLKTTDADQTGIVEYTCDNMENLKEEDLNSASFDNSEYEPNVVTSGTKLDQGAFVYKVITSETWNIYLPLTDDDRSDLSEVTKVYLHLNDANVDVAADFSIITGTDGKTFGKCTLSRYMIQLADRRYTTVTLLKAKTLGDSSSGLKIPRSSVLSKDCYIIPDTYAATGDNSSSIGFIRASYTESGIRAEFITPEIYAHTDGYYYIGADAVDEGTVFLRPDSSEVEGITPVNTGSETSTEAAAASSEAVLSSGDDTSGDDSASVSGDDSAGDSENSSADADTSDTAVSGADADQTVTEDLAEDSAEEEGAVSAESDSGSESEAISDETASSDADTAEAEETTDDYEEVAVPSSGETYTVRNVQTLQGVLCVNKGYCVFRRITIFNITDDYYIAEEGQAYSLNIYDHILLNADSAEEGDILYQ